MGFPWVHGKYTTARDLESFDIPRSHSADVSAGDGGKKSLARMGNFQNHRRAPATETWQTLNGFRADFCTAFEYE